MERGKKKETLTPEERLQAALVPDWEQPYKVPENWCWIKLGTVCSLENGKKQDGEELVYLDAKTLRSVSNPKIRNNGIVINENQKVILVDGENSGEVFIVPYRGYMGSTFRIINISSNSNEMYIRYFIDYNRDGLKKNKVGSAIPHLNKELFFNLELPFPPLKEQQRIVDHIESLFAKLDEAKQKAQDALDSFEPRKAAILHKAFTGELTVQWRKEHDVGMESWSNTTLSKIVVGFKYGTSEKSDYSYKGMPVFRIPNITDDGLSFKDLKFLPYKNVPDENQIHENDILIIRSNGSRKLVGKSVLVPRLDQEYTYASFLIRIQTLESVLPNYLVLYLNSSDARRQMFKKAKSSAGINNINSKELGAILIELPSLFEQTEIVRILDTLLAKEQQAKETAEEVLEQINLIKKAILACAFRGKLGTNDPSEESAENLIKRVIGRGE